MAKASEQQVGALADEAEQALGRLVRDWPELARRARAGSVSDGYPTRSIGDGGSPGGSEWQSSTERIAVTNADATSGTYDPVRRDVNGVVWHIEEAVRHLRAADGLRAGVLAPKVAEVTAVDDLAERSGLCVVCEQVAQPIRRGMCVGTDRAPGCYPRWVDAGRPDVAAFRHEHDARRLAAEIAKRMHGEAA